VSGPGAVELNNLSVLRLETTLAGPGRVSLSGVVDTQKVRNSGPGEFDGRRLQSSDADVDLSGLGDVTLCVRRSLRARVSGNGSIYYVGDPDVDSQVTGMGSVVQIGG
jgi:hypothetical protein